MYRKSTEAPKESATVVVKREIVLGKPFKNTLFLFICASLMAGAALAFSPIPIAVTLAIISGVISFLFACAGLHRSLG